MCLKLLKHVSMQLSAFETFCGDQNPKAHMSSLSLHVKSSSRAAACGLFTTISILIGGDIFSFRRARDLFTIIIDLFTNIIIVSDVRIG